MNMKRQWQPRIKCTIRKQWRPKIKQTWKKCKASEQHICMQRNRPPPQNSCVKTNEK